MSSPIRDGLLEEKTDLCFLLFDEQFVRCGFVNAVPCLCFESMNISYIYEIHTRDAPILKSGQYRKAYNYFSVIDDKNKWLILQS